MPSGRRTLAFALAAALLVVGVASPASADKVSDLKAKAERIALQIEQQRDRAAQLAEQLNRTQVELEQLDVEIAAVTAKLAEQDAQIGSLSKELVEFAVATYEVGDQANGLSALLADDDLALSLAQRRGYSPLVLGSNQDVHDTLKATRQDTDRLQAQLQAKQAQKERVRKAKEDDRKAAAKAAEQLKVLQNQTDSALAKAVADAEAARRAAAEAAARAEAKRQADAVRAAAAAAAARAAASRGTTRPASGGGGGGGGRTVAAPQDPGPEPASFPAPSPAAARAVSVALAQRGKPYVFATAGPDTFDCSGLTQYAWGAAGVYMNHWTVSQWQQFPHVPLDALQPGDLVFFGADVHHMGMYIGGGQMVHAPYTGTVVQVGSIYTRGLYGAARPG